MTIHPTPSLPDTSTLVSLLRWRAMHQPDQRAYIFLADGEQEIHPITHRELDEQARAIAAHLQGLGAEGERALLLYPPGLEYIAAFFGCLYASVVAVPAYPPRLNRPTPRLEAIVANAGATVVLALTQTLADMERRSENTPYLAPLRWVGTDSLAPSLAEAWQAPPVRGDSLAFLQYTSGSTSTPKGVILTHDNLLSNLGHIARSFELHDESAGVIWLPPYHDMGLIGGIMAPLYQGFPAVLIPPVAFLQRPMRWLEAISRYKGTVSGGPNFAYEACLHKSTPEQRAALDLSHWEVAFSGAEPIRPDTLARFAEAFAPAGFRAPAFYPCYGLAEATLIVSGGKRDELPLLFTLDAARLAQNEVVEVPATHPDARTLVGCGQTMLGQEIVIADPATKQRQPEGKVGEIWVTGPSVAQGYWERPADTEHAFRAHLADSGEGPFLRTGDLGFMQGEELFVTGRLKDLIIIRGRNHYPQDIELTVQRSHPSLLPEAGAAFAIEVDGEEQVIVAQEISHRHRDPNIEEIAGAIRQAVAEEHELHLYGVLLLRAGSIPKTSSGKIQRHACRIGFLDNTLTLVGQSVLGLESAPHADEDAPPPFEESFIRKAVMAVADPTARRSLLTLYLQEQVARLLRVSASRLNPKQPLSSLGLDSLMAFDLKNEVESSLGVVLPLTVVLEGPPLEEVAAEIVTLLAQPPTSPVRAAPKQAVGFFPLSYGQRSLWFLQQLAPESTAYTIANAVTIRSPLNVPALRQAFQNLVARHPALRTTFHLIEGDVAQQIHAEQAVAFQEEEAGGWAESQVQARLDAEVQRPFDLEQGPLLRLLLLKRAPDAAILLLTVHHSIMDLWSLVILMDELRESYAAALHGSPVALPALAHSYVDFQRWQAEMLAGREGEQLWRYWAEQLAGELPPLALPTDFPRPPFQSYRGAALPFTLPGEMVRALKGLAKASGTTLYTVLLAAFQVLLARYSGQDQVLVGSPAAGRDRVQWVESVGYYVNPVVLRGDLFGNPSFADFLAQVRQRVVGALAHQSYPFPLLVERLQPERDPSRSPLFQAMFVLEKPHRLDDEGLAALVLGQAGARLELGDLTMESYPLAQRVAQFDLTLMVVERADGLQATLEYNSDLFLPETAARLAANFAVLLGSIVAEPQQRVGELPLLAAAERERLLVAWNQTALPYASERCLHELVEAQAARTPQATALVVGHERLSYQELNQRAEQLAHTLRARGVGPERCVGIALDRSADLIVSLLGVLKAGGTYVPLDLSYPTERLAFMLEDTQSQVILTHSRLAGSLPPHEIPTLHLDAEATWQATPSASARRVHPDNLAYLIYTSGSTGRPKGVAISHRSAVSLVAWASGLYGPEHLAGVLASTSVNFDLSIFEIFVPLSLGGTVILAENALALPDLPAAQEVTLINTVPSAIVELLRLEGIPASVRRINLAGEPLRVEVVRELYQRTAAQDVYDLYGPSEDTTYSTFALRTADGPATIGRPISNTQLYLLDQAMQPVPQGVPGELYLGGDGLARGYLNRPALTAEKFVPNPFSAEPGARLYRTGDLARFLPDGRVVFLGRLDHQVKVRGFRIELGEIESALRRHPAVAETVVVARSDSGETQLVGYVVAHAGQSVEPAELRRFLKAALPDYMVPTALVTLDAMPLTPNGKIDRRALPAPDFAPADGEELTAPRNEEEARIASLWAEVLGVQTVGIHQNFFELGGHSLLATRLVSRLREAFAVELPVRALFAAPTVASLTEWLTGSQAERSRPTLPPVQRRNEGGPLPLSFAQQRLWLLEQLEPGTATYNMPAAVRLRGPLDVAAIESALSEIVRRHEALRTTFVQVGQEPRQVIAPPSPFTLARVDLRDLSASEREGEAQRQMREEARQPFDLTSGPLFRGQLLRLDEDDHLLLLTMHHIVSDGWSLAVLIRELVALYPALAHHAAGNGHATLPELPIQYGDFALWQRETGQGEAMAADLAYWRARLDDLTTLELPTDKPRPPLMSYRGAHIPIRLPADLSAALHRLGQEEGATLFMVLLAAFQALLARATRQEDIVVGSPISGRTTREVENLIGVFVNTLVLRTDLSGNPTFRETLARVREGVLEAFAHQTPPFEQVVEALHPARDLSRHPLFQVMFAMNESVEEALQLPDLTLTVLDADTEVAKFDLTLTLTDSRAGLVGSFEYNTDLFEAVTIERLAGHLTRILSAIAANPAQRLREIPLLSPEERQRILYGWNETSAPYPADVCYPDLFEQQVARTPDAVALIFEETTYSYAEINRRANQLAHQLRQAGVGPDTGVGVCLERSPEVIIALLAALKAGGAYVPLDPENPTERLALILDDAPIRVIITQAALAPRLPTECAPLLILDEAQPELAAQPTSNLPRDIVPENLAYVIYTSGSTGQPKGVAVAHRALVCHAAAIQTQYHLQPSDRVLLFASFSFDTSLEQLLPPLMSGAGVVLRGTDLWNTAGLAQRIADVGLTVADFTTAHWHLLAQEWANQPAQPFLPLRLLTVGGETLLPDSLRLWQQGPLREVPLANAYGPTEATITATSFPVPPTLAADGTLQRVPIGRPLPNRTAYILDEDGQPVPVGIPGELVLGGIPLARGYLNRPAPTAASFVPDPFGGTPGARLYRTGDLARYLPDGTIEFLGRRDAQVKIRGFRIELGEIEAALGRHPAVRATVVVAHTDGRGTQLVAYVVPQPDATATPSELRAYLKERLPDYMVPAALIPLEALPLKPSGKVDRYALPAPTWTGSEGEWVAPRTPTEEGLAALWGEVLGLERVSVRGNFFELGGHSLLATQLLARVQERFDVEVPLRRFFEAPTIEGLAVSIAQEQATELDADTLLALLQELDEEDFT